GMAARQQLGAGASAGRHAGDLPAGVAARAADGVAAGAGAADQHLFVQYGLSVAMAPFMALLMDDVGARVLGEGADYAEHVFGDGAIEETARIGERDGGGAQLVEQDLINAGAGGVDPLQAIGLRPGFGQGGSAKIGDQQNI